MTGKARGKEEEEEVGCSIVLRCLGRKMICIHLCGHMAGCSVEYSEWLV